MSCRCPLVEGSGCKSLSVLRWRELPTAPGSVATHPVSVCILRPDGCILVVALLLVLPLLPVSADTDVRAALLGTAGFKLLPVLVLSCDNSRSQSRLVSEYFTAELGLRVAVLPLLLHRVASIDRVSSERKEERRPWRQPEENKLRDRDLLNLVIAMTITSNCDRADSVSGKTRYNWFW